MSVLGVLGGTFDPPHRAHSAIARAVLAAGAADVIRVVPAGQPWQKQPQATAHDRLAMARLAFAGEQDVVVDDVEVLRDAPTYAIDTVMALRASGTTIRWIVGSDAFALLPTWHRASELAAMCEFIVIARPGVVIAAPNVADVRWQTVECAAMEDSSTTIRREIAEGRRPDSVCDAVWQYIQIHRLYGVHSG